MILVVGSTGQLGGLIAMPFLRAKGEAERRLRDSGMAFARSCGPEDRDDQPRPHQRPHTAVPQGGSSPWSPAWPGWPPPTTEAATLDGQLAPLAGVVQ